MIVFLSFFFNDTATTEIYTLSLHDALPISELEGPGVAGLRRHLRPRGLDADRHPVRRRARLHHAAGVVLGAARAGDRKSTRLNSSHANISYAVFCLKKKNVPNAQLSNLGRP